MKNFIPKTGIKAIDKAIEALFMRLKARFLGYKYEPKQIRFTTTGYDKPLQHREDLSLPSVFEDAARLEGFKANTKLLGAINESVEQYLDAHQELTKARVKSAIQTALLGSETSKEEVDVAQVIKKELTSVMEKASSDVAQVIDGEMGKAKNLSTLDAITKTTVVAGVEDPTIAFIGPNDKYCCKDCQRLYFMPDGVTPRVWKLSEIKVGWMKHNDLVPSMYSHNHCRHTSSPMMPGFGFVNGKITYIEPGYDIWKDQRGIKD